MTGGVSDIVKEALVSSKTPGPVSEQEEVSCSQCLLYSWKQHVNPRRFFYHPLCNRAIILLLFSLM